MKCNICGAELPDEAKFCPECGTKVASQSGESIQFRIGNRTLVYNSDMLALNKLHVKFAENAWNCRCEFLDYYAENVKTFEDIYNKAIPFFEDKIAKSIDLGFRTLIELGVDDKDRDEFFDIVLYINEPLSVIDPLIKAAEDIQEYADALSDYRDVQRSGRSHWQGGGFGVKGAIKGAITAGALNFTAGAFRSIGDSITNANDRQKIKNMKDEVLNNPETKISLAKGVFKESHDVLTFVIDYLEDEGLINRVDLDNEKQRTKYKNYVAVYNSEKQGIEKVKDALIDCLQIDPFSVESVELYKNLYYIVYLEQGNADYITDIAQFFGFAEYYAELVFPLRQKIIKHAQQLPEATKVDIVKKIQSLQRLHDFDSGIDFSDEVLRLKRVLAPTKYQG